MGTLPPNIVDKPNHAITKHSLARSRISVYAWTQNINVSSIINHSNLQILRHEEFEEGCKATCNGLVMILFLFD